MKPLPLSTSQDKKVPNPRLLEIDILTGLSILLVVTGHLAIENQHPAIEWYSTYKRTLYLFHMPLFMFLSGAVMFYSYGFLVWPNSNPRKSPWVYKFPAFTSFGHYLKYLKKKFWRLMPGYLLFAFLIWISKSLASGLLVVDNPIESASEILLIFTKPQESYSGFLWYIYVLFAFYSLFPLGLWICQQKIFPIIVTTSLLALWVAFYKAPTAWFALDLMAQYAIFFALGGLYIKHRPSILEKIGGQRFIFILPFAFGIYSFLHNHQENYNIYKLLLGLSSLPAFLVLQGILPKLYQSFFLYLRQYTFSIYLMNTLSIGLVKGLFFRLTGSSYDLFYLIVIPLVLAGLFIPIFCQKFILSKIPV